MTILSLVVELSSLLLNYCCHELFSYSFARTAQKFIQNVSVHMKLCMCNFHDHTIFGCGITSLELVNFTKLLLSREIILQYCMSSIKMRELGHFLIFQFHASRHSVNVNHFNNSSVRVIYEHLIYYTVILHHLI